MAGSATENFTKLSFASEWMQAAELAHNFVDFCLQTTSTVSEVSRCWSPLGYLPSSPLCQTLCRWDVKQSPFTVIEIDLCGQRPPLLTNPDGLLHSFSLTGMIFLSIRSHFTHIQWSWSQYFTSINHLSCGFLSQLLLKPCYKKPPYSSDPPDWSTAMTSHATVNSDARSIQISSQSIWIRC